MTRSVTLTRDAAAPRTCSILASAALALCCACEPEPSEEEGPGGATQSDIANAADSTGEGAFGEESSGPGPGSAGGASEGARRPRTGGPADSDAPSDVARGGASPHLELGPTGGARASRTFAWGIAEPVTWNALSLHKQWDFEAQLDAAAPLEPELFMVWMAAHHLQPEAGALDPERIGFYKWAIERTRARGWPVVVMDHGLPAWVTGVGEGSLPCYDPAPGSPYREFLERYETMWEVEAGLFPEVSQWIPGNEPDVQAFVHPATLCPSGATHFGQPSFTGEERARIAVDMMFHARRGIRRANPGAFVWMPGLTGHKLRWMQRRIYEIIQSGEAPSVDPRDYFDGINWHPYAGGDPSETGWLEVILEARAEVEAWGDAAVPVLFGEMGFTDFGLSGLHDVHADWMQRTTELARAHMPWLTAITWFRLFDDPSSGLHEGNFGIMSPPAQGGAWKSTAYTHWSIGHRLPVRPDERGHWELGPALLEAQVQVDASVGAPWTAGGWLLANLDPKRVPSLVFPALGASPAIATEVLVQGAGEGTLTARLRDESGVTVASSPPVLTPPGPGPWTLSIPLPAPGTAASQLSVAFAQDNAGPLRLARVQWLDAPPR